MKEGGSLNPDKAAEILADGQIRNKKLTKKQLRYFHYVAGDKAENGGSIQQLSDNPYSTPVVQFNGPSHQNGGIDIQYKGNQVEVEGQETGFEDQNGAFTVLGNLNVPGTKTKFKTVGKQIAKSENKAAKQFDSGITLVNKSDTNDKFGRLSFNAGAIMADGAQIKQKELAQVKEGVSALQNDMLEQANALGVDPKQLQKGKAKFGIKLAQEGAQLPQNPQDYIRQEQERIARLRQQRNINDSLWGDAVDKFKKSTGLNPIMPSNPSNPWWMNPISNVTPYQSPVGDVVSLIPEQTTSVNTPPNSTNQSLAQRNNNPGNLKYAPWMKKYGATPGQAGTDGGNFAVFPSLQQGQQAMIGLLRSPSYQNRTVIDGIKRWTNNSPYGIIPEQLKNRKISSLNPQEMTQLYDIITRGEDSKSYNWEGIENPNPPGINLPPVEIVGQPNPWKPLDLEPIRGVQAGPLKTNISTGLINTPNSVNQPPSSTTTPTTTRKPYKNNLRFGQIAPEIFTIATERADFVPPQRYEPQLYQPYQVSFQDRLNQNQSTFNAISRQIGGNQNASAVAALAAQKYQADNAVLADEFRTNQGITNDITNKNVALLNQAQLTNLQLDDQQFVRQEQARVNTRQNIRNAVQSISDKVQANQRENANYNLAQSILFPQYGTTPQGNLQFYGNQDLQFVNPRR